MRYIVDDIETIVNALKPKDNLGAVMLNKPPFYQCGRRNEIADSLAAMDKQVNKKDQKYPVIALILDTEEPVVNSLVNWNLTVVIATLSDKTSSSKQRYDKTIKPVLVPIYEDFLRALKQSGLFVWPGNQAYPPHTRTIRPYWGTPKTEGNEKLILDDPLDAIEITELKINSTNKPNCL